MKMKKYVIFYNIYKYSFWKHDYEDEKICNILQHIEIFILKTWLWRWKNVIFYNMRLLRLLKIKIIPIVLIHWGIHKMVFLCDSSNNSTSVVAFQILYCVLKEPFVIHDV